MVAGKGAARAPFAPFLSWIPNEHHETLRMTRITKGFTLVEIMIVVAIIGILAALAIPSFMQARRTSQANACINNLRLIESAKDQYALEHGLTNSAVLGTDTVGFGLIGPATLTGGKFASLPIGNKFTPPPTSDKLTSTTGGGYLKVFPNCPSSTNLGAKTKSAAISAQDYMINPIGSNATCIIMPLTHVLP